MHLLRSRAIATAAAAAIALTTMSIEPAAAGHDERDDAAAVAAFVAILGTIATIVAAERYRTDHSAPYDYDTVYRGRHRHHHHRHWHHHRHR